MSRLTAIRFLLVGLVLLLATPGLRAAPLAADELLLIANRNNADSVEIARYYAKQRNVPENRVLQLDLPFSEKCTLAEYQERIAAPVRQYLAGEQGRGVRCLVLFYGVPLQVGPSPSTQAERDEVAMLRRTLDELNKLTPSAADDAEKLAKELGVIVPKVEPIPSAPLIAQAQARLAAVEQAMQKHFANQPTDVTRAALEKFNGFKGRTLAMATAALERAQRPPTTGPTTQPDAAAVERAELRTNIARQMGPFALYSLIDQQIIQTSADQSDASVDSELALVRRERYPRLGWMANPLKNRLVVDPATAMLVSRVDGPTPQIARRIIDDAIATEKTGLSGRAAFDSRGIGAKKDAFGVYDEDIRSLAGLVKGKTKLPVVHDDRAALINPHAAQDVAIYCGWYSVRQYIPSCDFVRGAVAYHIASWELISLRTPNEKGWVANLLRDNVCASLGAVSEPYLHSFPLPSEFFPLLLSGKLSLAECYWATVPMTSWKLTLVGDPLYRPFAANPALKIEDLSEVQKQLVQKIDAPQSVGR